MYCQSCHHKFLTASSSLLWWIVPSLLWLFLDKWKRNLRKSRMLPTISWDFNQSQCYFLCSGIWSFIRPCRCSCRWCWVFPSVIFFISTIRHHLTLSNHPGHITRPRCLIYQICRCPRLTTLYSSVNRNIWASTVSVSTDVGISSYGSQMSHLYFSINHRSCERDSCVVVLYFLGWANLA